ncbi:MAG: 50S ribosomal protein L17 [Bacillota bacterium]
MLFRKLGRSMGHRQSLFRNGVIALFEKEKIETTEIKAKEIRMLAEKVITIAKKDDLQARRRAARVLNNPEAVKKLFETIAPKYKDRNGGYTRIVKLEQRRGDAAPMAIIELV